MDNRWRNWGSLSSDAKIALCSQQGLKRNKGACQRPERMHGVINVCLSCDHDSVWFALLGGVRYPQKQQRNHGNGNPNRPLERAKQCGLKQGRHFCWGEIIKMTSIAEQIFDWSFVRHMFDGNKSKFVANWGPVNQKSCEPWQIQTGLATAKITLGSRTKQITGIFTTSVSVKLKWQAVSEGWQAVTLEDRAKGTKSIQTQLQNCTE